MPEPLWPTTTVIAARPISSETPASAGATEEPEEQSHGFVEGAEELTEAQSSIASIGADGSVHLLNLLTAESTDLGSVADPSWAVSDGRFVFAGAASGPTQIIDTGVWTVPHGDHVHYYRAAPGTAGELAESGPARVSSSEGIATLSYAATGTTVVLDRLSLGQGEMTELTRIASSPHAAAAAPVGGAVVASTVDAAGGVPVLTPYSLDGQALGTGLECPDLSAVHETSLGATFACSDGLLFAAEPDAEAADATPVLTRVEYPATDGAGAARPPLWTAAHTGPPSPAPQVTAASGSRPPGRRSCSSFQPPPRPSPRLPSATTATASSLWTARGHCSSSTGRAAR